MMMQGATGFPPNLEPHAPNADQDTSKDAFLQPQRSPSSPVRHRSKDSAHHMDTVAPAAASADLSDLVRDYNALSARCQASEQQLARIRLELSKERQRSRQLMASYDALTLRNLNVGRQLQHRASTEGPLQDTLQAADELLNHRPPAPTQPGQGSEHRSSSRGTDSWQLLNAQDSSTQQQQHPAAHCDAAAIAVGPLSQAMLANAAAGRYRRWSTDTEVVDQGKSNSSSVTAALSAASAVQDSIQPVQEPAVDASRHQAATAGSWPTVDIKLAAVDSSLQSLQAAAAAGTRSKKVAGSQDPVGQQVPAGTKKTSPLKRTAEQQDEQQQQQDAAQQQAAAGPTGSPKKHKQDTPPAPPSDSSAQQPQALATAAGGAAEHAGMATTPAAAAPDAGSDSLQQTCAGGEEGAQAAQHQQLRGVSKRPAQQCDDSCLEDQPDGRATRRLRTGRRSRDNSSSSSQHGPFSSPRQQQQQQAAASSCAGPHAGAVAAAATRPDDAPKQQPAGTDSSFDSTAATGDLPGGAAAAAGRYGSSSTGMAADPAQPGAAPSSKRDRLPPAPGTMPFTSSHSNGSSGGNSGSSAAYRPSRLSAASDSSTWAIVPVGPCRTIHISTSTSMCEPVSESVSWTQKGAGDSRGAGGSSAHAAAGAADQEAPEMRQYPQQGPQNPKPAAEPSAGAAGDSASASHSSSGSYRKKAAKAAKAVANKLRKLFLGVSSSAGTGRSPSHSRTSSTAGPFEQQQQQEPPPMAPGSSADSGEGLRNSQGSSRGSSRSGSAADFRRSWQGPFFSSSGAAARAAAQAQAETRASKDDSHAPAGSKGQKSSKGRWRPPKWARKYYRGDSSDSDSSSADEADDIFNGDPFGPTFSPLRHNFRQRHPEHNQQGAAAGAGHNPYADPFGPAFSPLRQSMGFQPSSGRQQQQQQGGSGEGGQDDGFGPDWLGID